MMRWTVVLMASLMLFASGCAHQGARSDGETDVASAPLADDSPGELPTEYRIGVDDQIAINVWRDPELSVTMPVRPDGKITVPLIGDVQAGGLTPREVATDIKRRLSSYIRDPDVTVILTELRSHEYLSRIRVTGAVEQPISLPYRQGMTALDAVLEAGGVNVYAAPDRTRVYRRASGGTRVIDVYLNRILTEGDLQTNVQLKPGDVITVPERLF